jgi:hypothetical protein
MRAATIARKRNTTPLLSSGRIDSVPEHAAALFEFVLVNLTSGKALLKNVKRRATRHLLWGRSLPRPCEPAHEEDRNGD